MTPVTFAEALVSVLEVLFDSSWLESQSGRGSQHPAISQWALCKKIIANDGRMNPSDSDSIHELLSAVLGNLAVIQITNGNIDTLSAGPLADIGSKEFEHRVSTIARNGGQFLDLMLEMSCLAWHTSREHKIQPIDFDGMADFRLEVPCCERPVIAECKRLSRRAGTPRFKGVIKKANKQIKNAGTNCFGIVYLDVSDRVNLGRTGDEVPPEIIDICGTIETILSRFYRSVSGVVVLWKQRFTEPMTDSRGGVVGCLIYRSTIVRHATPKFDLPRDIDDLLIAYTAMVKILPDRHATI